MRRIVSGLIIAVLVAACDDEKKTCKVNKAEISYGAGVHTTFDIYHTDERISALRSTLHAAGNVTETYLLYWDGDRLDHFLYQEDGSSVADHYYYTYGATTARLDYFKVNNADTIAAVSEDQFYIDIPQDGQYYLNGVVYEVESGNVVSRALYEETGAGRVIDPDSYVYFEHDDHENTLRHLYKLPRFLPLEFAIERIASRNNIIKVTFASGDPDRNYEFEHDDKGNILNIADLHTGRLMAFGYQCK